MSGTHDGRDAEATTAIFPEVIADPTGDPTGDPIAEPRAEQLGRAEIAPAATSVGPTVRWGALVWSLLFMAIAAVTLWIIVDTGRRDAAAEWFASLGPFTAALYALLALGLLIALFGLVGLLRRGERARRRPS